MAQRTFSSQLWTSVTAKILLLFLLGLLSILCRADAKSQGSQPLDDGGVTVPRELPHSKIFAIKNRPLTLHCPIIIDEDAQILDLWWIKDGVKLELLHQPQQQQQHHNHHPSQIVNSSSTTSDQQVIPRIELDFDGDLIFDRIIHKVSTSRSSFDNRHKNYSDEGEYRCAVKSAVGVVLSPVITVYVAALEAKEGQEEVKVKAGQAALLECQISSTPPLTSTDISWQRGSTNISRLAQESGKYILSSGTLAISKVQLSDAGTYRCTARNDLLKKERSADIKLVVEVPKEVTSSEPPKFLYSSEADSERTTIVLDEYEDLQLDCIASGIPLPTITWVLTYEPVNDSSLLGPMKKILAEGKVFYDSVLLTAENPVQNGNYTCIANNNVGHPLTKTFQVARLPALLRGPNSFRYPPAKTVRFECRVPPTFTLTWYKDGQLLETGRGRVKAKGNEIVISNTIRNDSGFYQCEVIADDRVYSVGTARLFVENSREAPDAPFDLQCIESESRMLVVSWKVISRENITAFSIHYMPIGGEERQKVTPHYRNYTIENLKPYTTYSIYVRSYSSRYASAQSSKITCTTLEEVPAKAPKNFVFEQYGPQSQLRIRWKPLSDVEARGKVILYKLQWRSIDGEFTNVRYIDGDADEFLITELTPGEPFEIRLLPSTSVGWPLGKENFPWTYVDSTNFDTNVNNSTVAANTTDYYKPPSMHLTVLSPSSILVNWSEPPRPKEVLVKGYRLTYSTHASTINDVVFYGPFYVLDQQVHTFLFSDFVPSTSYEVQLQTFGNSWESFLTSKFIGTLSENTGSPEQTEDFLPIITGLQVHPMSSSSVRLTWELPKTDSDTSSSSTSSYYYTVKYNEADSDHFQFISSTSASVDIKDLKPYTSYEFVVQTTLDGHGGPFSQKIESRTLPGIPGPPVKLHWRVLEQSLVEVEWHPPAVTNGIIQEYWVQYKSKNESVGGTQFGSNSGNKNDSNSDESTENTWKIKSTKNTSLVLENLLQNQEYAVRVIAETRAGRGNASELIFVRIFIKKPPQDQPGPDKTTMEIPPEEDNKNHLGIILGVTFSIFFIAFAATIIVFRHRCFPILLGQSSGAVYVNGNGLPPRAKRSVESFNGVEMKNLETLTANDQHIDTKGGHPNHANGVIPGPTDPLLMRIVQNPIESPYSNEHDDEESVPNCIH